MDTPSAWILGPSVQYTVHEHLHLPHGVGIQRWIHRLPGYAPLSNGFFVYPVLTTNEYFADALLLCLPCIRTVRYSVSPESDLYRYAVSQKFGLYGYSVSELFFSWTFSSNTVQISSSPYMWKTNLHCPKNNPNLRWSTIPVMVGAEATVYVRCLGQIYVNKSQTYSVIASASAVTVFRFICGNSDYFWAQCGGGGGKRAESENTEWSWRCRFLYSNWTIIL